MANIKRNIKNWGASGLQKSQPASAFLSRGLERSADPIPIIIGSYRDHYCSYAGTVGRHYRGNTANNKGKKDK